MKQSTKCQKINSISDYHRMWISTQVVYCRLICIYNDIEYDLECDKEYDLECDIIDVVDF